MQSKSMIVMVGILLIAIGAEFIWQGEGDKQGMNSVEVVFALLIIICALALAIYFIFRSPGDGNNN